jgi:ubiquinone/menaquinone biosynthesis C-methylase UbiE
VSSNSGAEPSASTATSFGRVAHIYDRTRSMSPGTVEAVARSVVQMGGLTPDDLVLEHAVGTGRIAVPLCRQGLRVVGTDISTRMLAVCAERLSAAPSGRLFLAQGDAVRLGIRSSSVDAVVSGWLLHVLTRWRTAIEEVQRVLVPDGRFALLSTQLSAQSPSRIVRERWHEILGHSVGKRPSVAGAARRDIVEHLEEAGAHRATEAVHHSVRVTPESLLARIEERQDSSEWFLPESAFGRPLDELRSFVESQFDKSYLVDEITTFIDVFSRSRVMGVA